MKAAALVTLFVLTFFVATAHAENAEHLEAAQQRALDGGFAAAEAAAPVPDADWAEAVDPPPTIVDVPQVSEPGGRVEAAPRQRLRPPPPNLYIKPPGAGHRLGRIGVELMMSVLAEAMGGVTGAMVGCASVEYGPQGCLLGFLIGALIGAVVGVPAGVVIGGYLMDGDGAIAATVAGALAGVALSAAMVGLVTYNLNADTTLAIASGVGFILMPNVLAILAFELTSHQSRRYHELTTPMKVTVVPTLGPERMGAALAISF